MNISEKFKLIFLNIIFIGTIIMSVLLNKTKLSIAIFTIIYMVLIYKYFALSIIEYLYFFVILLALIGSGVQMPITLHSAVNLWYVALFLYYIIIAGAIFNYIKNKSNYSFLKNRYTIFFVIFILYAIISLIIVKDIRSALGTLKLYIVMISLMLMFFTQNIVFENVIKKTFKFLMFIYTGILVLGTTELFGIKYGLETQLLKGGKYLDNWEFFKRIPVTFFYNQNNYAIFLIMGMIFLVTSFIYTKNKNMRYVYVLLYIVSQINLVFTSSRISIITLFIILVSLVTIGTIFKDKVILINSAIFIGLTVVTLIGTSAIPVFEPYYAKVNDLPFIKYLNASRYISKQDVAKNVSPNKSVKNSLGNSSKSGIFGNSLTDDEKPQNEFIEKNETRLAAEGLESGKLRFNIIKNILNGVLVEHHYLGFGMGNTSKYLQNKMNFPSEINAHSLWFEILGDFGIFIFIYSIFIYSNMILKLFYNSRKYRNVYGRYCFIFSAECFAFVFLAFAPSSVIIFSPFFILVGLASTLVIDSKKLSLELSNNLFD